MSTETKATGKAKVSKKAKVAKTAAPKAEAATTEKTLTAKEQKAADKAAKTAADKKAKEDKAAKAKAAKAAKGPGVIASIKEFVEAGPVKESALVKQLKKRFADKEESSMLKTVKAQIGSNKRPVRMERELAAKGVKWTLTVEVDEKSKEKTYSAK